ncbi:MAG TPA: polyprenyl synthetase family protein [Clostridiales bacterium]|nr:polyprenyl synthetase family protein [Clostridiales bacterium]
MTDLTKEALTSEKLNYEEAVAETSLQIRHLLKSAPVAIRKMTVHLSGAPGKMIRAKSLLACALDEADRISPDAVKAAASVELIHLATLVHDDVIDQADKRRGIKALHQKFGQKYAVLCGDWLLCVALEWVSTIDPIDNDREKISRVFPGYMTEVCLGELRQNQNMHNYRLSERQYFQTIRGKTAALFEACFYGGHLFSGEPEMYKEIYTKIGNNIGLIFQLADDCADYESTQKETKKPVLSDCSSGVITLPLIHALKKDSALKEKVETGMDPIHLKEAVVASGGLEYTHGKIQRLHLDTVRLIRVLDISSEKSALLEQLLNRAAGKTHA